MARSLKYDAARFSAFKSTSFQNELEALLTKNGKVVPWPEFKKEALKVSGLYNVNWMETEYHQTVATANMAAKWEDFQQNKDLYPNLRYDTVGDDRVRQSHKVWDGLIAPLDHPIWKRIYPPNDHGCRCGVTQTDEPATKDLPEIKIKAAFDHNPAISGKIYNEIPYEKALNGAAVSEANLNALRFMARHDNETVRRQAQQVILNLPRKEQFIETFSGKKGKVIEHLLVNQSADDYSEITEVAIAFAKKGKVVELLPELVGKSVLEYRKTIFPKYDSLRNPDLRIDNIYFDVKRPQAIKNVQGKANDAHKQLSRVIIHTGKFKITDRQIENRVNDIFSSKNVNQNSAHNYPYDVIYFFTNGKLLKYKKPE